MRYAECETVEDIEAINPVYWEDGVSGDMEGGCWLYQLPSLKNGDNMFSPTKLAATYNGRISLWKFVGNLQSLESGVNMFAGCSLDYESVRRIADTLPTVTTGTITIGIDHTLETDIATQEALAVIRGKGWTVEDEYNLPYGFTELEYLENNGRQRINTGVIAQDDMSFEYQFILENYGNAYLPLFGNPNGSGAPDFGIGFIGGTYRPMWGDSNVTAWMYDGNLPYGVDITVISERDKGTLITPNYSRTVTHKYGSLDGNANTIRIGEAPWFGNTSYVIKHKHFVIKQEERTILDLVPVLDPTGVPCMYDKVSKTCFYNSGKGKFGYKIKSTGKVADIEDLLTELEYLESSGTQSILTTVPGGSDALRVAGKASIKAHSNYSGIFGNFTYGNYNCTRLITNEITAQKMLYGYINAKGDDAMYAPQVDYTQPFEFDMSKTRLIINAETRTPNQIVEGAANNLPIRLFSMWANTGNQNQRVTFYAFSAYEGQEKIIDLVPVLDASDVPCMFDKISRTCFYNAGTGTFGYRIKTLDSGSSTFSLRDPYYTAPSGVYARLVAENELDMLADTEMESDAAEQYGYTWFADTGEAYEHFGITLTEEEVIDV